LAFIFDLVSAFVFDFVLVFVFASFWLLFLGFVFRGHYSALLPESVSGYFSFCF